MRDHKYENYNLNLLCLKEGFVYFNFERKVCLFKCIYIVLQIYVANK